MKNLLALMLIGLPPSTTIVAPRRQRAYSSM